MNEESVVTQFPSQPMNTSTDDKIHDLHIQLTKVECEVTSIKRWIKACGVIVIALMGSETVYMRYLHEIIKNILDVSK